MIRRMPHTTPLLAVALVAALGAGCASTGEIARLEEAINRAQTTAEEAKMTAEQASAAAAKAQRTADEANAKAEAAQDSAAQAKATANAAYERADRMFQKSMRK